MSIRAVWVVGTTKNSDSLLLYKTFANVEQQARCQGNHVALPEWEQLEQSTRNALSVNIQCNSPSYEIQTPAGILWPVITIEQYGLHFCALPLTSDGRKPLSEIDSVSSAFCLLLSAVDFLGPLPANVDEFHPKLAELVQFLSEAAPLGLPLGYEQASAVIEGKISSTGQNSKQKQVPWRTNLSHKSRNTVSFAVSEKLQGESASGRVVCRMNIDGLSPEVRVTLSRPHSLPHSPPLPITHPSVLSAAVQDVNGQPSWKLHLIPPTDPFVLCLYESKVIEPPVQVIYQMRGQKEVQLSLQLKKNAFVPNNFDFFEIQMPFLHRGVISKVNCTPLHGTVMLSVDKKSFIWKIGNKFPNKILELNLDAALTFEKYSPDPCPRGKESDDVALTSYAQVVFKVANFCVSGLTVNQKIDIVPSIKCKISTAYEFQAEFKAWNINTTEKITE